MGKSIHNKTLFAIKMASYGLGVLALALILYFSLQDTEGVACAVETTSPEFSISTYPSSSFITSPNMAPGDKVSADLTVKNDGQLDFSYDISAVSKSVDQLVYEALDLQIRDSSGLVIYDGKMKDLQNAVMGIVGPLGTQVLSFTVGLPMECGNEYQGKGADITFVLNAVEHPASIAGEIIWDPPLEKPDVHVRRGVIMPVRFHIVENGTYDTVKRGIDLEITGVNDAGEPVRYVFSTVDGTLGWEEHGLNKPHYALMFDAGKYPVKFDTYYTATVRYGDQVLGSTQFISGH